MRPASRQCQIEALTFAHGVSDSELMKGWRFDARSESGVRQSSSSSLPIKGNSEGMERSGMEEELPGACEYQSLLEVFCFAVIDNLFTIEESTAAGSPNNIFATSLQPQSHSLSRLQLWQATGLYWLSANRFQ